MPRAPRDDARELCRLVNTKKAAGDAFGKNSETFPVMRLIRDALAEDWEVRINRRRVQIRDRGTGTVLATSRENRNIVEDLVEALTEAFGL